MHTYVRWTDDCIYNTVDFISAVAVAAMQSKWLFPKLWTTFKVIIWNISQERIGTCILVYISVIVFFSTCVWRAIVYYSFVVVEAAACDNFDLRLYIGIIVVIWKTCQCHKIAVIFHVLLCIYITKILVKYISYCH